MKQSCETCQFWTELHKYNTHKNIRKCNRPVQLWDAEDWVNRDGETVREILPEYKDLMMFTQDASSYQASLYTRNDFFCAHWEKKNA